jgi:hypothetical protein
MNGLPVAKTRLRGAAEIDLQIKTLLDKHRINRTVSARIPPQNRS